MSFWHDQEVLHGITTRAHFFDSRQIQQETALSIRALPFLLEMPLKTLCTEQDRKNFFAGEIAAQPDAVFEHATGLISLEYKYAGYQQHHQEQWRRQIRLKDMLQCLLAGYAVAQNYKKITACVLRYHNVCYLLTPSAAVIHTVFDLIPLAKQYFSQKRYVAASKLAQFASQKVQDTFPRPEDERSKEGRAAHESLLRR
jgi:hypothetical protein